jgi:hypothetical protein
MKNLKSIILALLCLVGVLSCKLTEKEVIPENVIISEDGIVLNLEWTTGGSAAQSLDDVDLDLILNWGTDVVDVSASTSFEEVKIENFYADGTYLVNVEYFEGSSIVDYSLYLRGTSSSDNFLYKGSLKSTDTGAYVDFIEINKSGNHYTIIDL